MTAMLKISDGTTEISLIRGGGNPVWLNRWRPAIAQLKGGGAWQQSALSDGRQMVDYQWDNVIETFDLKVSDADPDLLARRVQDLRRLLIKATDYWATDWQDDPVYLITRAENETNIRYAVIHSWSTPDDEEPFGPTFRQADGRAVMDAWTLSVERGHWLENAPGTGTATEVSATGTYNSVDFGRAATTTNEVYFANKHNLANLTHIFIDDAGAWTSLLGSGLPYDLLPAAPAVGDHLYFGINTALANSGPFCSLVFDLSIAGAGYTCVWEYWNGAWVALTVQDNTDTAEPLDTLGVNSVHWGQPGDWATVAVNLITGWWVRIRITGIPGALTAPRQQLREPYSITWAYTEVANDQIAGTLDALTRMLIMNQSDDAGDTWTNRLIVGLRSKNRGANFVAYLNAGPDDPNDQNPTGVSVTYGAMTTAVTLAPDSVTGYPAIFNPPGVIPIGSRVTWTFDSTIAAHFSGVFHAYVRVKQVGGSAGDMTVELVYRFAVFSIPSTTPIPAVATTETGEWLLLDLGRIEIPGGRVVPNDSYTFSLSLEAGNSNAAPGDLYIYDLILIPVDEWAAELKEDGVSSSFRAVRNGDVLDIDSVTIPRTPTRSLVIDGTTDEYFLIWRNITNGQAILHPDSAQRLWFIAAMNDVVGPYKEHSEPWMAHSIQVKASQRYLSMRGDR